MKNEAERIVLLNASEDYGLLWQILGEVRDSMPSAPPEEALRAARGAAVALLKAGRLEVYRRKSRRGPFELLSAEDGAKALATDAYWRADERDETEIAVATRAG